MSINITGLNKYYGEQLIVNDFSIDIIEGEFFALLGASGSGKSTVLKMIAGLTHPSSGKIELNGKDVTNLSPQKREIGFVFQNYAIFKHMTVAENIEFGLRVRKVSKSERMQRQEELLEIVGLSGLGGRYPHEISGGQRQRVALARALAYKPSVLLLDEPFGALDASIRSQLRESVREIQNKLNITTILVTHDQEEAFELADRIGVIEKGKLVEVGSAHALYHSPHSPSAATFIGSGNVLVGRVREGKIKLGNVLLDFPPSAPTHTEGDPVRVVFRPENISCVKPEEYDAAKEKSDGRIYLGEGTIDDCLFSGAFLRTRVKMQSLKGVRPLNAQYHYGEGIIITSLQPSSLDIQSYKAGDKCHIFLKSFHVLDPCGLRILIKCRIIDKESPAWQFGSMLATAGHGNARLLHVYEDAPSFETEKKKIEDVFLLNRDPVLNLEIKVKQGEEQAETLLSAQEGFFEVVVMDRQVLSEGKYLLLDPISMSLLGEASIPVLLMAEKRDKLNKILVCTAAGEPGKADVLLGARFARQTGAEVTVLHVMRSGLSDMQKSRAERHLKEAKDILNDLGVIADTVIKKEPALETIISIANEGDYDLIVMGAPAPRHNHVFHIKDLTPRVIFGTKRPVLVVPMKR
jgi:sulfate transport system ATP-binding protein